MAIQLSPAGRMRTNVKAYVWDITDGYCCYCGDRLHPFRTFTIDHIDPVSRGGPTEEGNLVPCCKWCNGAKRDRPLESLRQSLSKRFGIDRFTFAFELHPEWLDNV